jgi:hypothetical protein
MIILLGMCAMVLAGCSRDRDPDLMTFKASQDGPDEFSILPTKPLETPEDFASLPTPTPGGSNLVDPTPDADAIVALGGRPELLNRPSGDGALVSYAARFGVAPDIRASLAAADLEYRRNNKGRLLERLFNVNVYFRAYEEQHLDQHRELERFRAAGIATPAAPPEQVE